MQPHAAASATPAQGLVQTGHPACRSAVGGHMLYFWHLSSKRRAERSLTEFP